MIPAFRDIAPLPADPQALGTRQPGAGGAADGAPRFDSELRADVAAGDRPAGRAGAQDVGVDQAARAGGDATQPAAQTGRAALTATADGQGAAPDARQAAIEGLSGAEAGALSGAPADGLATPAPDFGAAPAARTDEDGARADDAPVSDAGATPGHPFVPPGSAAAPMAVAPQAGVATPAAPGRTQGQPVAAGQAAAPPPAPAPLASGPAEAAETGQAAPPALGGHQRAAPPGDGRARNAPAAADRAPPAAAAPGPQGGNGAAMASLASGAPGSPLAGPPAATLGDGAAAPAPAVAASQTAPAAPSSAPQTAPPQVAAPAVLLSANPRGAAEIAWRGLPQDEPAAEDGLPTVAAGPAPVSAAPNGGTVAAIPPAAPGLPDSVSRQIVAALHQAADGRVDLSLSPEELGRVRLSLSVVDGGISVHVAAERPETLALLRRHIDLLAQDFRALGYDSVDFGFSDRPGARGDGGYAASGADASGATRGGDAVILVTTSETPMKAGPVGGLDLRL